MIQPIHSLSKLGTESAFEVLARAETLSRAGKNIINLGIGQPDFQTPKNILEAGVKALRDGHHGYTAANGILPLREAISSALNSYYNIEIDPNLVLVVPGGKVTMFFAITMFGDKESEVIYPNPGFPIYESLINFSGAKAVPMPLYENSGYAFDADEVLSLITPKTRLLILNSPSNPTGGALPEEEIMKLAIGLDKYPNVCILSDEIYSRILYDNQKHISFLQFENLRNRTILLDGFSKTYAMTGWRIGYSVWPQKLIKMAIKLSINYHSCVNAAAQFAGIEALNGSQNSVNNMVTAFSNRRKIIVEKLNQIDGFKCPKPGGAFYAFPNISGTGYKSNELQKKFLEEAGVALISGNSFGHLGEGYLRFSYANSEKNIITAINRIQNCLR